MSGPPASGPATGPTGTVLRIVEEAADSAALRGLLAQSDAASEALYPPESRHPVDAAALAAPGASVFVARLGAEAVGCVALIRHGDAAEIKRLFVTDAARQQGVARALLAALEARARRDGVTLLRLETGVASGAALALYRRSGFVEVPAFPPYRPDPLSVFFARRLNDPPPA